MVLRRNHDRPIPIHITDCVASDPVDHTHPPQTASQFHTPGVQDSPRPAQGALFDALTEELAALPEPDQANAAARLRACVLQWARMHDHADSPYLADSCANTRVSGVSSRSPRQKARDLAAQAMRIGLQTDHPTHDFASILNQTCHLPRHCQTLPLTALPHALRFLPLSRREAAVTQILQVASDLDISARGDVLIALIRQIRFIEQAASAFRRLLDQARLLPTPIQAEALSELHWQLDALPEPDRPDSTARLQAAALALANLNLPVAPKTAYSSNLATRHSTGSRAASSYH